MNWFLRFWRVVLLLSTCYVGLADDGYANAVDLNVVPCSYALFADSIKLQHSGKTALCPDGDAIVLTIPEQPESSYTWYWNETRINGLNTNSQTVSQPGTYYARIRNNATGLEILTTTVTLTMATNPTATLRLANPNGKLCERDSLQLLAEGGIRYHWFLNGTSLSQASQSTFYAKQAGRYSVTVTDANGCESSSEQVLLTLQPRPKPVIDSIPPVCGRDSPVLVLRASPAGGIFSGEGVNNSIVDPKQLASGNYMVTYESPVVDGCAGEKTQRTMMVVEPPIVQVSSPIVTSNYRIVSLEPSVVGNAPFSYRWQPSVWLTSTTQKVVNVTYPKHDTTYTVRVTDRYGCVGSASIRISVQANVNIPDAFTPNGDQVNDTWKLLGIESFPQARVTVYNRWGEVVFQSYTGYLSPFDGRYNGEPLPAGVYLYVLKLSPDDKPMRGRVVIAR